VSSLSSNDGKVRQLPVTAFGGGDSEQERHGAQWRVGSPPECGMP
jgi:hypothetical protein